MEVGSEKHPSLALTPLARLLQSRALVLSLPTELALSQWRTICVLLWRKSRAGEAIAARGEEERARVPRDTAARAS